MGIPQKIKSKSLFFGVRCVIEFHLFAASHSKLIFSISLKLRMKAKLETLINDLSTSSTDIDQCYTGGVVDGFTQQFGPYFGWIRIY